MSKIVRNLAVGVVAVGAIYLGGVYATSTKLNDFLANINENVAGKQAFQNVLPGATLSYNLTESSFFSQKGDFILAIEDNKFSIPSVISKGFLSAECSFDTEQLRQYLSSIPDLGLEKDSLAVTARAGGSAISGSCNADMAVKGKYLDKNRKDLDADLSIKFGSTEKVRSRVRIRNLNIASRYSAFRVEHLDADSTFVGIDEIREVGKTEFTLKGIETMNKKISHLHFESEGVNMDPQGNFDLAVKAEGDSLFDYIYDFDIHLLLCKMNVKELSRIKGQDVNSEEVKAFLSRLSELKINKLNGRLSDLAGLFVGIRNLSKLHLTSSGSFTWDYNQGSESLKGNLVINSDSKEGAERFFVEKDGTYECVIGVDGGKLSVNGQRFM